jgi:hypothetical protein
MTTVYAIHAPFADRLEAVKAEMALLGARHAAHGLDSAGLPQAGVAGREGRIVSGDANAGVPHLEHNCGSWTIVCRDSGKPVFETFERHIAQAANQVLYEVLTTRHWSDCAVHNAPAYEAGPCDCGGIPLDYSPRQREVDAAVREGLAALSWRTGFRRKLVYDFALRMLTGDCAVASCSQAGRPEVLNAASVMRHIVSAWRGQHA